MICSHLRTDTAVAARPESRDTRPGRSVHRKGGPCCQRQCERYCKLSHAGLFTAMTVKSCQSCCFTDSWNLVDCALHICLAISMLLVQSMHSARSVLVMQPGILFYMGTWSWPCSTIGLMQTSIHFCLCCSGLIKSRSFELRKVHRSKERVCSQALS